MKSRGYDAATIRLAEEQLERQCEADELCPIIETAFAEVKLGNGIGLYEAQAIDDYADDATRIAQRAGDEKDDWRKITSEELCICNSSLCFFDAEGMKFHLPAFLICDLKGEYGFGMMFCLCNACPGPDDQFRLLSREQRIVVRLYLLYLIHEDSFDRPDIEYALNGYWAWPLEIAPSET